MNDSVVAIIPIRSGSVGVKDKNIRLLGGKPLVAWAIEAAKKSKLIDRVIVDTDSEKYAAIARSFGAETPFLRPAPLAEDVPTEFVLVHAVEQLEAKGYRPDVVVCLQCTTPLVKPSEIDACIIAVVDDGFDSAMTITEVSERPEWMFRWIEGELKLREGRLDGGEVLRGDWGVRQTFEKFYRPTGSCYVMTAEQLVNRKQIIGNHCTGILVQKLRAFDIDTPVDFDIIEAIIRSGILEREGNRR